MSLLHIHYPSAALQRQSAMYLVLPEGEGPFRVVYLLHGYTDDYTTWLRRTSIERYAELYGLMVVMLDGGRSFYTDMRGYSDQYEQHILESVRFVDRTFRTVNGAKGRGISGQSMGGYGAMKLALKHPRLFGSVAAQSGVLDIDAYIRSQRRPDMTLIFGETLAPEDDCFALAAAPGPKPAIRIDCGVNDFLIEHNRRFHAHLDALGVAHQYHEYPGEHNWAYWDRHVPAALRFHRRQMR